MFVKFAVIFVHLAVLFSYVNAFTFNSNYVRASKRCMSSDESSGSVLPTFDEIVTPRPAMIESPLMDRALDSALDFLQKGDGELDEEDEEDEFDMFEIFEESPDIEIPYDLIAELEQEEAVALANKLPAQEELNNAAIQAAVVKWRKHDKDCGSAEVQVAISNERIKYLTKHLLKNKHDVACKRGLDHLVTHRRKFLNYLFNTDRSKAEQMIAELGIRFRPPGRLWDKASKYGAFKNTKTQFKTSKKSKVDKMSASA
jgi:ribosomal protein S15